MLAFIISFTIAALITPLVIWWYRKNQWLDDPEKNPHVKITHQLAVPRGGGLVIMAGILLTSIFLLPIDRYLVAILTGAVLLTLVGIADDIWDISPFLRLGSGLLASLIVVGAGIGIAYVSNPFGPGVIQLDQPRLSFFLAGEWHEIWIWSCLFAIFFINWNMNIVNWSKGFDGQLPGFVSIAAIMIGLLSSQFHDIPTQFTTATLSFIVAGAFAGLLIWNWYPQKIMPGYGAGSLAGFFLSVLAILSGAKVATTLMVLAIPTADGIFTIARRLLAGKSPFWGDRGHLHHKLMDVFGWGRRRIALFYWLTTLVMGGLSLWLDTTGKIIALVAAASFVFGLQIWAKLRPNYPLRLHSRSTTTMNK
jgi:UDP-GlcNAc:undecaprenyl-phosphate GlcNAc-1-phosphate transferase